MHSHCIRQRFFPRKVFAEWLICEVHMDSTLNYLLVRMGRVTTKRVIFFLPLSLEFCKSSHFSIRMLFILTDFFLIVTNEQQKRLRQTICFGARHVKNHPNSRILKSLGRF